MKTTEETATASVGCNTYNSDGTIKRADFTDGYAYKRII